MALNSNVGIEGGKKKTFAEFGPLSKATNNSRFFYLKIQAQRSLEKNKGKSRCWALYCQGKIKPKICRFQ